MSPPKVERQLRWLERPLPWILSGTLASFGVVGAMLALQKGSLASLDAEVFGATLRGYTVLGLLSGFFGLLLAFVALAYSLRKRMFQERLAIFRSTMMTWLWSHVSFGVLALVLATFHAGYGLMNLRVSTGKFAFILLLVLVVTGVVWRLVYQVVPARAAPRIGNYAEEGSLHRADEQRTEIEKLAAGRSAELRAMTDALLSARLAPEQVAAHLGQLHPSEHGAMAEIARLSMSRDRALERARLQKRFSGILQAWRLLHVPVTVAFVPALLVHVAFALDLPAKLLIREVTPPAFAGYAPSQECASCHRTIYDQWQHSMHAHAMKSPVMIAQNNQLLKAALDKTKSPDPRGVCVNCHGPVGVLLADDVTLPLRHSMGGDDLLNEGISCVVCHQYRGKKPLPGQAGLSHFQDGYQPGGPYFGAIRDSVGNARHESEFAPVFQNSDDLCVGCHNVSYDTTGDGKIVKGQDLVLQVTDEEYQEYRQGGGDQTCITCHMPRMQKTSIAETASIPFEQDVEAKPRALHDHSFVGVDYPLDAVAVQDPQRPIRDALLKSAARIALPQASIVRKGSNLSFDVTVSNVGTGHYLPTGFAFARQMWLEVTIVDAAGSLFSSGVLANNEADLCDAGTLDEVDNPMRPQVIGCDRADPQLVNFQRKLVDHFDVATDAQGTQLRNDKGDLKIVQSRGAHEEWLQLLSSGVVDRVRPIDQRATSALKPGETKPFRYAVQFPRAASDVTITARLLFRSLPPYMIRAMGDHQPPAEKPRLSPLVKNLQVMEMAAVRQSVGAR